MADNFILSGLIKTPDRHLFQVLFRNRGDGIGYVTVEIVDGEALTPGRVFELFDETFKKIEGREDRDGR